MDYLLFFTICVVATFSPGPAVLLAIKNSASYGVGKSIAGILGNVTAMVTMASLSALGLSAILAASESLFVVVKIVGGVYLVYLGIKTWVSTLPDKVSLDSAYQKKSHKYLFIEAYLVGITNPKALVFYSALFPQFIDMENSITQQFTMLTLTFALLSFTALLTYAVIASRLSGWLKRENIRKAFNKVTGGIFVGFGVSLIASNKT